MSVAPHAGAWIETMSAGAMVGASFVAPHVGAWIETTVSEFAKTIGWVAPHVGAWIETMAVSGSANSITVFI